jgi:vesicle-fusing ATPase
VLELFLSRVFFFLVTQQIQFRILDFGMMGATWCCAWWLIGSTTVISITTALVTPPHLHSWTLISHPQRSRLWKDNNRGIGLLEVVNGEVTDLVNNGVQEQLLTEEMSPTSIPSFRNAQETSAAVSSSTTAHSISTKDVGSQSASAEPTTTPIFNLVAELAAVCLYQSDIRRDAIGAAAGKQASSATNWIHDPSAFLLQKAIDQVIGTEVFASATNRDVVTNWWRWCKAVPASAIIDWTDEFHQSMETILVSSAKSIEKEGVPEGNSSKLDLSRIDTSRADFLSRLACRLILLPSGSALDHPLSEPPASLVYGKLLYGGVTRGRLLGTTSSTKTARRTALRTLVQPSTAQLVPAWLMYGGPDRWYEAVDMGPAAILEVILLPRGKKLIGTTSTNGAMTGPPTMVIAGTACSPNLLLDHATNRKNNTQETATTLPLTYSSTWSSGQERNQALALEFGTAVGGLQPQIDAIVRRVLDGRVVRPVDGERRVAGGSVMGDESWTAMEAKELELLGLSPVRGLLLYGPPGCGTLTVSRREGLLLRDAQYSHPSPFCMAETCCRDIGKTALAREISRALRARAPKIVSAPELLDRWVGGSEKLVRLLFANAEAELAACQGDVTKSALHVVVIDEIDAVFRRRSSAEDSGEATRSSVVNQILSKLDGVNSIPNLLLIGMTNRKELLDDALLRPGRLEVQIEIPLPDKHGRREILNIHFDALRQRGRLSNPLCCAIDGTPVSTLDHDAYESSGQKRWIARLQRIWRRASNFQSRQRAFDLASDAVTGGFSGADIAGLVRCAGSLALSRARQDGNGVVGLLITLEDVKKALVEVKR